jgi:hypothetical protein
MNFTSYWWTWKFAVAGFKMERKVLTSTVIDLPSWQAFLRVGTAVVENWKGIMLVWASWGDSDVEISEGRSNTELGVGEEGKGKEGFDMKKRNEELGTI